VQKTGNLADVNVSGYFQLFPYRNIIDYIINI